MPGAAWLKFLLQHVPYRGEHLVRYYGWYSNRSRGNGRAARATDAPAATYRTRHRARLQPLPQLAPDTHASSRPRASRVRWPAGVLSRSRPGSSQAEHWVPGSAPALGAEWRLDPRRQTARVAGTTRRQLGSVIRGTGSNRQGGARSVPCAMHDWRPGSAAVGANSGWTVLRRSGPLATGECYWLAARSGQRALRRPWAWMVAPGPSK